MCYYFNYTIIFYKRNIQIVDELVNDLADAKTRFHKKKTYGICTAY